MKNYFLLLPLLFTLTISNAQTVTSITPNSGAAGNTISAVITCQNTFFQISSPQGVREINLKDNQCRTLQATNMNVIDNENISIDFNIPANKPNGIYDLELVNWTGPALWLTNAFTITGGATVELNAVSPTTVNENQIINIVLTGQNLDLVRNSGGQIRFRKNGKTFSPVSTSVINSSTLHAQTYIPAYCDTGLYDVEIIGSSYGCYLLPAALHVTGSYPKQLVSISPSQTPAGSTLSAVVTARNTFFMTASPQGINKIQLEDQHCNVIDGVVTSLQNDTTANVNFSIPADTRNGFYDVFLKTEMNTTYLLPTSLEVVSGFDLDLLTFSPNSASAGTTLNAVITGSGVDHIFNSTPVTAEIKTNTGFRIAASNINATSTSATLDFQIPIYAENANYDLDVSSGAGCYSISQALQISGGQPREILSVNPNSGYRGQTLSAVMTGSNTYFMSGTPQGGIRKVDFTGQMPGNYQFTVNHPDITVLDTNHAVLDFTIPINMHTGWYTVTSENYAGDRWSLQPGFEILGTVLSGTVTFDIDSSGTSNVGDTPLPGRKVLLLPDSVISITDADGNYFFSVDPGQYTIEMFADTNWFVTTSPQQYSLTVDTSDISLLDFGLQPLVDEYSVYATVTPGIPRCGTNMNYTITYTNNSTTSVNGQVYAVIDTALTYINSVPPYDILSNDTMYWNYSGLGVNNSATIILTVAIPSIAGDTIITNVGIHAISGTSEVAAFTNSNTSVIRCSYDPNDKSVEPIGVGSANYVLINGYLEYLIRFQNTGNDTAFTVMVLDTISESLDMSTFSVVAQSHATETHIYGNVVEFRCNNILLADSFVNEPASHGFVKYRIKPFSNSTVGTTVENEAGIYFDLNQPVITNTTVNTLTDQLPVGIQTLDLKMGSLVVYPNPSSQYFNLKLPEDFGKNALIRIVNLQNQIVRSISTSEKTITIDISDISQGIYFVYAISSDGQQRGNARIVKLN